MPKHGTAMCSDDEIRRDVLDELTAGGIPVEPVQIAVRGGVVAIEGDLADEARARQIEKIAGQVDGVVAVRRHSGPTPGRIDAMPASLKGKSPDGGGLIGTGGERETATR